MLENDLMNRNRCRVLKNASSKNMLIFFFTTADHDKLLHGNGYLNKILQKLIFYIRRNPRV